MPELVKNAFDDPSWRSNPRMPLMTEMVELFWKAYEGEAWQSWRVFPRNSRGADSGAYGKNCSVAEHR